MRVSLNINGFSPMAAWLELAVAAEDAGFDGVWFSEHVSFRDSVVPAAVLATRTKHIEIGIMGATPTTRHPVLLAMELASLAEIFPNRIRVQVGTGADTLLASIGGVPPKPLAAIEALVASQRALLAGQPYTGEIGRHISTNAVLYTGGRQIPVDVLAIRPRMMELASNIGDGVSLSAGASCAYIQTAVAQIRKGRNGSGKGFRVTAATVASIADDYPRAIADAKAVLAAWSPEMLAILAPDIDVAAAGPVADWPPELIHQIALIATPETLEERLAPLVATGIDELALGFVGQPEGLYAQLANIVRARDALAGPDFS